MPRFAANLSLLFDELPVLDRVSAAGAAGFTAVELQFPHLVPRVTDLAARSRDADVEFVQCNIPVDLAEPRGCAAAVPGAEDEFATALEQGRELVEVLGCSVVNILAGGTVDGVHPAAQLETLVGNLQRAAQAFADLPVVVCIEALNSVDIAGSLVATQADAVEVIEQSGADIRLQLDAYHVAMMKQDPVAILKEHAAMVGHVQFADAPGRHEPGTGSVDIAGFFAVLDAAGYTGWTSAEYIPSGGDTVESLHWL